MAAADGGGVRLGGSEKVSPRRVLLAAGGPVVLLLAALGLHDLRLDRGPAVGALAPAFTLSPLASIGAPSSASPVGLASLLGQRPLALAFGSAT